MTTNTQPNTTDSSQQVDIDHIANLARIALSEEEKTALSSQFDQILAYFKKLDSVNTDGVEPMAHAFPVYNVWRNDEPGQTFSPENALLNAPDQRDNQLVVPAVIE